MPDKNIFIIKDKPAYFGERSRNVAVGDLHFKETLTKTWVVRFSVSFIGSRETMTYCFEDDEHVRKEGLMENGLSIHFADDTSVYINKGDVRYDSLPLEIEEFRVLEGIVQKPMANLDKVRELPRLPEVN